jgi:peptidoglycan hydrolase CwlO-like protein
LKSIQAEKQSRQAQLEPLQERAEKMLTEIDTTKGEIGKIILETEELMKEHIIA